jgi:hypothetical protein
MIHEQVMNGCIFGPAAERLERSVLQNAMGHVDQYRQRAAALL